MRRLLSLFLIFVFEGALLAASALPEGGDAPIPRVGDRAPEISLKKLLQAPSEAEARLEALRGKVVVLEFWATWCRPCLAAVPHLNKVQESLKGEDIVFLSVTNEGPGKAATAFRRVKFETIVVSDTTSTLHRALRILYDDTMGLPRTVLLDRDNKILWYGSPHKLSRKFMLGFMKKED